MGHDGKEPPFRPMKGAVDLFKVAKYRIAIMAHKNETHPDCVERYITLGETDPYCDDLYTYDTAEYATLEEASYAMNQFAKVNSRIGLFLHVRVVGVNCEGMILSTNG